MIISKTSGVMDSAFGKSQEPIRMILEEQEEAWQKMSIIDHIFFKDETKDFANKYTTETSMGDFKPVGEAGKYPETDFQEGYSKVIEPETWKNSFAITQEMIEDSKMGKVRSKTNQFMMTYNRTRELFAAKLLSVGNATTMNFGGKNFDISCADGKAMFATDHPSITGGTAAQSNLYGGAFSYDNLSYAEEKMHYFKDDNGQILTVTPDTIIIPDKAAIKKLVFEAIGSENNPTTANNATNFHFGRWNIVFSPYLEAISGTSGDCWMLMDSTFNDAYQALIWLDRIPLTLRSTFDENTDNNVWRARARHGAAPNNWRTILCSAPGLSGATAF